MCGEMEGVATFGTILGASHMWHKCMCRWANMDLSIGATALIADCNGVGNAPHIVDALGEMALDAEMLRSCAVAASVEGSEARIGGLPPRLAPVAAGKIFAAKKLGEDRYYMQDAAGGLVATMASESDYLSPTVGRSLEKYYKVGMECRRWTGCGPSNSLRTSRHPVLPGGIMPCASAGVEPPRPTRLWLPWNTTWRGARPRRSGQPESGSSRQPRILMKDWDSLYQERGVVQKGLSPKAGDAVEFLREAKADRILDLGCGTGRHAVYLAQNGFAVTG